MTDLARAQAEAEVATRNASAAVITAEKTRNELLPRIEHLERLVGTQAGHLSILEQKYNILLGSRFDGKSTSQES